MRKILIPLVILLWLILGWKMCTDQQDCCGTNDDKTNTSEAIVAPAAAVTTAAVAVSTLVDCGDGIVCIADNSHEASYGSRFNGYIDSLKATLGDGEKLKITGYYTPAEQVKYDGSMANLGLHRADVIRQKIGSKLSDSQVELVGQQVVGRQLELTNKIGFDVLESGPPTPAIAASTAIYFPYNSTQKLKSADINSYLIQVATRVKSSGERVQLEGHTDSNGPTDGNQKLGLSRAQVIKNILVDNGVTASKITVSSQGEAKPVATNGTSQGRALNRRTELTIIK